jgi:uncharacterized C2H2 Zn-finger protein
VRKNECHECHECHDKERHSFCHGTRSPMISRSFSLPVLFSLFWGVLGRRWCAAAPRPEWVAGARLCHTPGLSLSDAARTCTQITEDTDHFKEHDGHDGHAVGPLLLHVPRCSKMFQDVPRCSKMFQVTQDWAEKRWAGARLEVFSPKKTKSQSHMYWRRADQLLLKQNGMSLFCVNLIAAV